MIDVSEMQKIHTDLERLTRAVEWIERRGLLVKRPLDIQQEDEELRRKYA